MIISILFIYKSIAQTGQNVHIFCATFSQIKDKLITNVNTQKTTTKNSSNETRKSQIVSYYTISSSI